MEATIDGELMRLRVAEFAAPAEPYLWRLRQEPTFLVTALREGLSALADAGLASLLARGEVGGVPGMVTPAARAAARAGGRLPGLWSAWVASRVRTLLPLLHLEAPFRVHVVAARR